MKLLVMNPFQVKAEVLESKRKSRVVEGNLIINLDRMREGIRLMFLKEIDIMEKEGILITTHHLDLRHLDQNLKYKSSNSHKRSTSQTVTVLDATTHLSLNHMQVTASPKH